MHFGLDPSFSVHMISSGRVSYLAPLLWLPDYRERLLVAIWQGLFLRVAQWAIIKGNRGLFLTRHLYLTRHFPKYVDNMLHLERQSHMKERLVFPQ